VSNEFIGRAHRLARCARLQIRDVHVPNDSRIHSGRGNPLFPGGLPAVLLEALPAMRRRSRRRKRVDISVGRKLKRDTVAHARRQRRIERIPDQFLTAERCRADISAGKRPSIVDLAELGVEAFVKLGFGDQSRFISRDVWPPIGLTRVDLDTADLEFDESSRTLEQRTPQRAQESVATNRGGKAHDDPCIDRRSVDTTAGVGANLSQLCEGPLPSLNCVRRRPSRSLAARRRCAAARGPRRRTAS